jgi:error-prone DNA polymerase
VTVSLWHCTLERGTQGPALRLGLCLVRTLPEADAERIVAARAERPFSGIDALSARAQLSRRAVQALAAAGALSALSVHRHEAHWRALGVERLPGLVEGLSAREAPAALPEPTESQNILADYRHLGLTIGRHPLALLRPRLSRRGFRSSSDLSLLPDGISVRVAGLITHMQQPATASGVVFASLEDETGIVNVILWPKVFAAQRRCALESSLLVVEGALQRRDLVAHVVARRLHDGSRWLAGLHRESRDFR